MCTQPEPQPLGQSHRIDTAHPEFRLSRRPIVAVPETVGGEDDAPVPHPLEALLPNHLRELIDKLQDWGTTLDRREAELNARMAMFEHRQRTNRMREQSKTVAINELERSVERHHQAMHDDLRRMAVGNIQVPR
ncbi:hypothetical protein Poly24_18610 [Rosistilla carotiformis]|uniref:Uncharacterized protein n=1 Tax=Rosistilla carotiformis TaxID=2528017 RepID=A0A518JRI0_9BACT|nr:hypothetical protein [Rosistilla carotiformis]QDV68153.1 hypothetical protein Poly24_18610 [Rosistilla carotiformis]